MGERCPMGVVCVGCQYGTNCARPKVQAERLRAEVSDLSAQLAAQREETATACAEVRSLRAEVEVGRAERAEHARVVRERDDARRQAADDREAMLAEADDARRAAMEEAAGIADSKSREFAGECSSDYHEACRDVAAAIRAAAKEEER